MMVVGILILIWLIFAVLLLMFIDIKMSTIIDKLDTLDQLYKINDKLNEMDRKVTKYDDSFRI